MKRSQLLSAIGLGFPIAVAVVLVFRFNFPYITAVLAILCWSAFGQLITLDDELSGGWSNPDGDPVIARKAKIWLASTIAVIGVLVWLVRAYPTIQDYRW